VGGCWPGVAVERIGLRKVVKGIGVALCIERWSLAREYRWTVSI
jgi:hypothetical protein